MFSLYVLDELVVNCASPASISEYVPVPISKSWSGAVVPMPEIVRLIFTLEPRLLNFPTTMPLFY